MPVWLWLPGKPERGVARHWRCTLAGGVEHTRYRAALKASGAIALSPVEAVQEAESASMLLVASKT